MNQTNAGEKATRMLLVGGLAAGPLFIVVNLAQILTTPGFDFWDHPVSLLMRAPLGWIQVANFLIGGVLIIGFAFALRRSFHPGPGGIWGPLFIGGFGLGLLIAGVFPPDPALGFPPGTREGVPAVVGFNSTMHGVGFMLSFSALTAACIVIARRDASLRRWGSSIYAVLTAVTALSLSMWPGLHGIGVRNFAAAVIVWLWTTTLAARLLGKPEGH